MKKKKIILIIVGSLFLLGGIIAGVILALRNQQLKNMAAPATSMSISPASQNKNAGDTLNFAVLMNTGVNHSIGFDLVLNFNPQAFQITGITQGSAITGFQEIRNNIDSTAGKIYYSVYNADASKAINGSTLTVLNVSATVKSGSPAGSQKFTFDSTSAVAGLTEGQNILILTAPGAVMVTAAATPTPTITPTPTATPEDTAIPTATPTATSSATTPPTATPNASPREIPVTGFSFPSMIMAVAGFGAIVLSIIAVIL